MLFLSYVLMIEKSAIESVGKRMQVSNLTAKKWIAKMSYYIMNV
jgi:hypothetical protein